MSKVQSAEARKIRNANRAADRAREAEWKAEQAASHFVFEIFPGEPTAEQWASLSPRVRELAAKKYRRLCINRKRQATLDAKREQRQTLVDAQKQALIAEFGRLGGVMNAHEYREWLAGDEIRYEAARQLNSRIWDEPCEDESGGYFELLVLLPDPEQQADEVLRAWLAKRSPALKLLA